MIDIPPGHWDSSFRGWESFVPSWERQLRTNIERQPDPQKRFEEWLLKLASGDAYQCGVRLIFLEQPYLAWAEAIEKFGTLEAKRERQSCIAELQRDDNGE